MSSSKSSYENMTQERITALDWKQEMIANQLVAHHFAYQLGVTLQQHASPLIMKIAGKMAARIAGEPVTRTMSRMPIVFPLPGSATMTCQLRLYSAERNIA